MTQFSPITTWNHNKIKKVETLLALIINRMSCGPDPLADSGRCWWCAVYVGRCPGSLNTSNLSSAPSWRDFSTRHEIGVSVLVPWMLMQPRWESVWSARVGSNSSKLAYIRGCWEKRILVFESGFVQTIMESHEFQYSDTNRYSIWIQQSHRM